MATPLLILCGGRSRRMGQPKALLPHQGRSLIAAHITAAAPHRPVWLAADGARYPDTAAAHYLPDLLTGKQGALSAIAPALQRARTEGKSGVYVMSCDTLLNPNRIIALLRPAIKPNSIVMLADAERDYPLMAYWPSTWAHELAHDVANGQRRVHGWLKPRPRIRQALPAAEQVLANFNTPPEWAAACRAWQQLQAA